MVSNTDTTTPAPDFDPDALREKYRVERDKRIRKDANAQYVEVAGAFAPYLNDPYTEAADRPPLTDDVTVAVIGGGFAGLITGARLMQAGIDDFRIIEKGGDFGGTWYWNRYPGAQCDVESYVYLPLLEETSYVPSEKYARAPEILEHCRRIARHFDLYERACLSTEVTAIAWDGDRLRWVITTNRGDRMSARFLVMGNGPLHRPKLPGIPGIAEFKGHSFHTSRWDYSYTGGDSNGALDGLAGKRVGIIGTGATAVQVVPHVAASAGELFVFQRTPSSIDVRGNRPTDPSWAAALEPGWQRERMENFTLLTSGGFAERDLVNDGWTDILARLVNRMRDQSSGAGRDLAAVMELADFEKMEQIRARVDDIVEDTSTAEALKPWYRQFCKRPCFHDDYLQAFNRPNVSLVDTDGRGVNAITSGGVVVGDREYQVDCLIYATGFEVGTDYTRRAGYDVLGSRGQSTLRVLAGRDPVSARDARARFSQHVRAGSHPGRLHGQLPPPPGGGVRAPQPHSALCRRSRHHHRGGNRGRRGAVARATDRVGTRHSRLPAAMHARLLQQRGPAHRRRLHRQLLRQGPDAILRAVGRVEGRRHPGRARTASVGQAGRPTGSLSARVGGQFERGPRDR